MSSYYEPPDRDDGPDPAEERERYEAELRIERDWDALQAAERMDHEGLPTE